MRHGPALTLFAAQWTDHPDDCVQEALLALVRQRQCPRNAVAWMYRAVRNGAISSRRAAARRQRREAATARPESVWFVARHRPLVEAEELTAALRALEPRQREIIVARIWGGLSFEELAETLRVSTSTAHRRYEVALRELRKSLGMSWPDGKKTLEA